MKFLVGVLVGWLLHMSYAGEIIEITGRVLGDLGVQ